MQRFCGKREGEKERGIPKRGIRAKSEIYNTLAISFSDTSKNNTREIPFRGEFARNELTEAN